MRDQRRILRSQSNQFSMSNAALKYLGWMCTLAGVIAIWSYEADAIDALKMILMLASYIALPIFGFLTVEGVKRTSNFGRYLVLTLAAAVVAEPFYDYVRFGTWFYFSGENAQNVLFTIAVTQVMLYYMNRIQQGKAWGIGLKILLVIAGLFWVAVIQSQYGPQIVIFALICYFVPSNKMLRTALIITYSIATYFTPCIASFFINRYDGERGNYNKLLFYILWPAMWIAMALMRLLGM